MLDTDGRGGFETRPYIGLDLSILVPKLLLGNVFFKAQALLGLHYFLNQTLFNWLSWRTWEPERSTGWKPVPPEFFIKFKVIP
jgi:hypothetical protein